MSEEHDSWLEGMGVDVKGILGSIGDATAGAAPSQDGASQGASTGSDAGGGSGALSALGSLASGAWDAAKGAASAGYDAYQKGTDFKPVAAGDSSNIDWSGSKPISVTQALGAGVDWYEKTTEESNKKMVASAEGTPGLEQLAKASAFINDTTANVAGGVVRGVGDLAGGLANVVAHPIDSAAGVEGILEHDSPVPFLGSTLKAAHGLYDVATGNEKGEYGSTLGDVASNILDPRKQQEDDAKFNSNLVRGIVAPGTKDWSDAYDKLSANPADMLARAATNVVPVVLGLGEAAAGDSAAEVSNVKPVEPVEPPPTQRTPYLPEGVPTPPPFNPDIPIIEPGEVPPGPKVINPGGGDVQINPAHPFYADPTAPTILPEDFSPPPDTVRDPPQAPKLPGEPIEPEPIPKLPGGPKPWPPIPREEPPSGPIDTLRQPMEIPGIPEEEPLPSTKPRPSANPDGPVTEDAPPSPDD